MPSTVPIGYFIAVAIISGVTALIGATSIGFSIWSTYYNNSRLDKRESTNNEKADIREREQWRRQEILKLVTRTTNQLDYVRLTAHYMTYPNTSEENRKTAMQNMHQAIQRLFSNHYKYSTLTTAGLQQAYGDAVRLTYNINKKCYSLVSGYDPEKVGAVSSQIGEFTEAIFKVGLLASRELEMANAQYDSLEKKMSALHSSLSKYRGDDVDSAEPPSKFNESPSTLDADDSPIDTQVNQN
ncbi:hypothetical protein [Antrihabitans cavernicola]|uniref:Uncharacterized protein n=1 Tax=Antrihabitans cavernicola TaxID=2495913 RepID=A0A5A7SFC3_9NOCA|nr:hypothetical protein [Spelaeibacter cavernicola]KAA0023343.1 hypothetical protein FOY51_07975 [Spelaeibacter cavernicola]